MKTLETSARGPAPRLAEDALAIGMKAPGGARIARHAVDGWVGVLQDYVEPLEGVSGIKFVRSNRGYEDLRSEWERRIRAGLGARHRDAGEVSAVATLLNFDRLKGLRVLDAGTGDGGFVEDLRKRGIDINGIDLALRSEQQEKPYFIQGSLADTQLPSSSFDLIVSSYSAFHYFDPTQPDLYKRSLKELGRILKPGGKLVLIQALHGRDEIRSCPDFDLVYPKASEVPCAVHFLLQKKA